MSGYDVIGDVHGYADALERLLADMGYRETSGAYRHPERQAVFVGDLIDRGPQQLRVLEIARSMVDAGTAQIVMGNHEFNAVAWATEIGPDEWARPHSTKNTSQHAVFLEAVGSGSADHRAWVEWFRTIPMWLDLGDIRVVHACWHPVSMEVLGGWRLTDEIVTAPKGSPYDDALEVVLKGPEVHMGGASYKDKDDHIRRQARFRWWDPEATTLAKGVEIPDGVVGADDQPFPGLPDDPLEPDLPAAPTGTPVLYGHYWRSGHTPTVDGPLSACLDWSIAKGGQLAAYRWSGETALTDDHLIAVR